MTTITLIVVGLLLMVIAAIIERSLRLPDTSKPEVREQILRDINGEVPRCPYCGTQHAVQFCPSCGANTAEVKPCTHS